MKFWDTYLRVFGRPAFTPFHTTLLKVALRGLGFQSWWSPHVTGEAWLLRRLAQVAPEPTVVDVGANVGAYSRLIMDLAPRARVLAIEPNPRSFALLQGLASRCGFESLNVAVGRTPGEATLYHQATDSTSPHASLHAAVAGKGLHVTSTTVPVQPLDHLISNAGIRHVHLLKIDTEGSELDALLGARDLIGAGQVDWIQFEFNTMNAAARVYFQDFQAALPNYRFYRLLASGVTRVDDSTWTLPNLFMYQNLLAIRLGAPPP